MFNLKTKTLLLVLSLCLVSYGCRKDQLPEINSTTKSQPLTIPTFELETPLKNQFFDADYILNANPNLRPLLNQQSHFRDPAAKLSTIQYLIDYQDDQENFLTDLSAAVGFPVWSQAEVRESFVFLPFIKATSDATDALLIIRLEAGIYDFKLLRRDALYHRILTEQNLPNFYTELRLFLTFDERLFDYHDPLLLNARAQEASAESDYRCPLLWYWECAEWIVPLWEEGEENGGMAEERSPCFSTCTDCVLIVYNNPTCEQNLPVVGWGSTNGGAVPPQPNGDSGYHSGGEGGSSGSNGNPGNWWEEAGYSTLVESIIVALGLEAEQQHLADCLAESFQLAAMVSNLTEELQMDQERIQAAMVAGLLASCNCDEVDGHGREICDEADLFEDKFRHEMVEWLTEGFFFSEEEKEFLRETLPLNDTDRVEIPKKDWTVLNENERGKPYF